MIEKFLPSLGNGFPFSALFGHRLLISTREIHLYDELTSFFELGFGIAGGHEAIVPDFNKT